MFRDARGCLGLLGAAQARNRLGQPQFRAASLRLQSRVLRPQSGNGIWSGQEVLWQDLLPARLGCNRYHAASAIGPLELRSDQ